MTLYTKSHNDNDAWGIIKNDYIAFKISTNKNPDKDLIYVF